MLGVDQGGAVVGVLARQVHREFLLGAVLQVFAFDLDLAPGDFQRVPVALDDPGLLPGDVYLLAEVGRGVDDQREFFADNVGVFLRRRALGDGVGDGQVGLGENGLMLREGIAPVLDLLLKVTPAPVGLVRGGVQTLLLAPCAGELLAGAPGVDFGGGEFLGRGFGVAGGLLDLRVEGRGVLHLLVVEAAETVGAFAGGLLLLLHTDAAIREGLDLVGEVGLLAFQPREVRGEAFDLGFGADELALQRGDELAEFALGPREIGNLGIGAGESGAIRVERDADVLDLGLQSFELAGALQHAAGLGPGRAGENAPVGFHDAPIGRDEAGVLAEERARAQEERGVKIADEERASEQAIKERGDVGRTINAGLGRDHVADALDGSEHTTDGADDLVLGTPTLRVVFF